MRSKNIQQVTMVTKVICLLIVIFAHAAAQAPTSEPNKVPSVVPTPAPSAVPSVVPSAPLAVPIAAPSQPPSASPATPAASSKASDSSLPQGGGRVGTAIALSQGDKIAIGVSVGGVGCICIGAVLFFCFKPRNNQPEVIVRTI